MSTLKNVFRRYIGDVTKMADLEAPDLPREQEITCVVARLQDFESLVCRASLRDLGSIMNRYYAAVSEAVIQSQGDVDRFCGPTIVAHYGQGIEDATVVAAATAALRGARDSLESALSLHVGLGLCRGTVIYGRFGTSERLTVTAFGPPLICADRLADEEHTVGVCELLATRIPLPTDPRISVHPHWNQPQIEATKLA
jgi:adenylate cyclase